MSIFLSQLPYILIAAGLIAAIAAVWAVASIHNAEERRKAGEKEMMIKCSFCSMAGICTGGIEKGNSDKDAADNA